MHPNCRRGSLPNIRGSRLSGSALLYLYSNICAPHRQDCCALFAYETALCDRKDTQSRFAANAARSIVCVETPSTTSEFSQSKLFQCRTQHCVCRDGDRPYFMASKSRFQCRTQHCVCRDNSLLLLVGRGSVSMPHAALCMSRRSKDFLVGGMMSCFNAARSIVYVETLACLMKRTCSPSGFNAARSIVYVETN